MSRCRNLFIVSGLAVATVVVLGGCAGPGDGLASVEQLSFIGDLGGTLGPGVAVGNTTGHSDDHSPSCGDGAAPDDAYTWTAPSTGTYLFSTAGSSFDTVLEVFDNATGASLGCDDDLFSTFQSGVSRSLVAGQSVTIVIDGFDGASGDYRLNISNSSSPPPGSGMHLWLRADTNVTSSGGRMSFWGDQSGNGRNASMPTGSRQPFLISNALNGQPVARFQGAQSMSLSPFAQPTSFSIFVVGKNNNPSASFNIILGPGGSAPNNQLRWQDNMDVLIVGTGNNLPAITSPIGANSFYHALSVTYNGSQYRVYRGGALHDWTSFSTTGPLTLASIGSWYSSFFLQGDIAEVIIYDHALSDNDRFLANDYLSVRYALP